MTVRSFWQKDTVAFGCFGKNEVYAMRVAFRGAFYRVCMCRLLAASGESKDQFIKALI